MPSRRRSIGSNRNRAWPPAWLQRQLRVVEQPAALHEVDDEARVTEVEEQVLAATAHAAQRVAVRRRRARGAAVFSAVKLNGVNFARVRPRNRSVSRSACAWISGISGIGGPPGSYS